MAISAVTTSTSGTTQATVQSDESSLDMNDFFVLMAAQLQNQSMYDPVDNSEFIAQMAQFSTLSQMEALTQSFASNYSVSLIGKTVNVQTTDVSGTVSTATGTVDKVNFRSGTAYIVVDGIEYETSAVTQVTSTQAAASAEETTEETTEEGTP